jgi:hypothetical protein
MRMEAINALKSGMGDAARTSSRSVWQAISTVALLEAIGLETKFLVL